MSQSILAHLSETEISHAVEDGNKMTYIQLYRPVSYLMDETDPFDGPDSPVVTLILSEREKAALIEELQED